MKRKNVDLSHFFTVLLYFNILYTVHTQVAFEFVKPDPLNSFNQLKIDETVKINTSIYRLEAKGGKKPLTFTITPSKGFKVELKHISDTTADVILKQTLDVWQGYSFSCDVKDSDGQEPNPNSVFVFIEVIDYNNNAPIFNDYQRTHFIKENSSSQIDTLLFSLIATDTFDMNKYGTDGIVFELQDESNYPIFRTKQMRNKSEALFEVYTTEPFDFENTFMYRLVINACDNDKQPEYLCATAIVVINVEDIDDEDPEFIKFPPFKKLEENTPPNTEVFQVVAQDGDRSVNAPIKYSITEGNKNNAFRIDPTRGQVFVETSLDREQLNDDEVEIVLSIMAEEVTPIKRSKTITCTVLIQDVNDEAPEFKPDSYTGTIIENSNTAINLGGVFENIIIVDKDQSQNAAFDVKLLTYNNFFELRPSSGVNEALISLRVKIPEGLDFEKEGAGPLEVELESVDKKDPSLKRHATVSVTILDDNDLTPQFNLHKYDESVLENAKIGTRILTVKATDGDTGDFGDAGIQYTIIDKVPFNVGLKTGEVTVGMDLDREKVSEYTFTIEARDDNGNGHKNTTEVYISLIDVNDNAPEFTSSIYKARLQENEINFQMPVYIKATDIDFEDNGKVNYKINSVDTSTNQLNINYFVLHSGPDESKELIISNPDEFDYEKLCPNIPKTCILNVKIEAYDSGNPSLNNFATVEITLMDVNDEIPKFVVNKIEKDLLETDSSDTLVGVVSATDADVTEDFRKIKYQFADGGTELFFINTTSGRITVGKKANLDLGRIDTDKFELSVAANDGIYRDNNDICIVIVNIKDVNNKEPKFNEQFYLANILESATITEKLMVMVKANDPDVDHQLVYSFGDVKAFTPDKRDYPDKNYYNNLFEIDSSTGSISVKSLLDRETVEQLIMTVIVNDTKTVVGISSATVSLTILIDDVNDNAPWFGEKYYEGVVTENVATGTEIRPVVTAIDIDLNQNVSFSLSGDKRFLELVNISNDGILRVASNIDREEFSFFNLTVIATDDGQPPLFNSTNYRVTVEDVNDNRPVFEQDNYEIQISEGTKINTDVLQVNATDADAGDFGKINFDFDHSKGQSNFKIDSETGIISVASELDRDSGTTVLEFRVLARDNIKSPLQSLTSTATVTVTLLDENDNAPVITPILGCVNVNEDVDQLPYELVTIFGVDNDDGDNGSITFYLADNNTDEIKDLFKIDSVVGNDKAGKLFVKKSLRGLIYNYDIKVLAKDKGLPVQKTEKMEIVRVCVKDVNDHDPVVHFPTEKDKIGVFQNLEIRRGIVFKINATDDDVDFDNKNLVYSIKSFDDVFYIEADGVVKLIKKFDRDVAKWYKVDFIVCDSGKPAPRCVPGSCRVIVKSTQDKDPYFKDKNLKQNFEFTEETTPGFESEIIFEAIDDDHDVSGLPEDVAKEEEKTFLSICYYIVGGSVSTFQLDPNKRVLTTKTNLDFETKNKHTLYIRATNDCVNSPPGIAADVDVEKLSKSYLTVTINVIDVNDHPPKFTRKVFGGGTDSSDKLGQDIMQINATDADVGVNAEVAYFMDSDVEVEQSGNLALDENRNSWFILNQKTGFISLNYDFSENMKGYIRFQVRVNNTKPLVQSKFNETYDTATVKIYVVSNDQTSTFVIRKSKDDFWKLRELFAEKLSSITGKTTVINSVVPYKDPVTDIARPEWSFVSVYYIDEENNVVDPSLIENMLDADYVAQTELGNEFAVYAVNKQVGSPRTEIDPVSTGLYATAGALILLLTAFLALYCSRVSKLKLQLKASTVSTYAATNRKKSMAPDMPTTNKHAKPASNPMYNFDDHDARLKESSDALSLVSEVSLDDNQTDFEGGENNGGFAGLLETMFTVENEANIDKDNKSIINNEQVNNQLNDNFIIRSKSGEHSPETITL